MKNKSGVMETFVLNPYSIMVRAMGNPEIDALGVPFGKDLIAFLDSYEKARLKIVQDPMLSDVARTSSIANLRDVHTAAIETYVTRAKQMAGTFHMRLVSLFAPVVYSGNPSPAVEATKQAEAREMLSKVENDKLISMLLDRTTSAFLFNTIIGSPIPLLSDDLLKQGIENRLQSYAPDFVRYRDAALEMFSQIISAIRSAYLYLQEDPDPHLRGLKLDIPGFNSPVEIND